MNQFGESANHSKHWHGISFLTHCSLSHQILSQRRGAEKLHSKFVKVPDARQSLRQAQVQVLCCRSLTQGSNYSLHSKAVEKVQRKAKAAKAVTRDRSVTNFRCSHCIGPCRAQRADCKAGTWNLRVGGLKQNEKQVCNGSNKGNLSTKAVSTLIIAPNFMDMAQCTWA